MLDATEALLEKAINIDISRNSVSLGFCAGEPRWFSSFSLRVVDLFAPDAERAVRSKREKNGHGDMSRIARQHFWRENLRTYQDPVDTNEKHGLVR
mmetsp:Transcript_12903/g.30038  ORF Transcript_12903/g.30038 Transcript_12903/m.30038 type:complete len:96 (-) Transcript_12903:153-440(-)